jgi:hypothetical protein
MDERDYKALNATELMQEIDKKQQLVIRNQRIVIISLVLIMFVSALVGMFVFRSMKSEPNANKQLDLLNTLHAIEVSRLNHAQMVLLNNINDSDKRNQMLVNENKALQERSNLQTVQYTNVINRIKQSAPIPCQIYIDSVDNECAKVVNAKDDVIDGLITRLDNRDSTIVDRDSLIKVKQARIETDSSNYVMNKAALQAENNQLVKSNKRTNFWGKVAIGAAVVWTGVVMYLTVVK